MEGVGRRGLGEKWKEECRQQLENFVFAKEIDALRYGLLLRTFWTKIGISIFASVTTRDYKCWV